MCRHAPVHQSCCIRWNGCAVYICMANCVSMRVSLSCSQKEEQAPVPAYECVNREVGKNAVKAEAEKFSFRHFHDTVTCAHKFSPAERLYVLQIACDIRKPIAQCCAGTWILVSLGSFRRHVAYAHYRYNIMRTYRWRVEGNLCLPLHCVCCRWMELWFVFTLQSGPSESVLNTTFRSDLHMHALLSNFSIWRCKWDVGA